METLEIIPLVMVIIGVVKSYVDTKWIPLIAISLGVTLATIYGQDITTILNGVLAGVGAVGTYQVAKGQAPVEKSNDFME